MRAQLQQHRVLGVELEALLAGLERFLVTVELVLESGGERVRMLRQVRVLDAP